MERTYDAREIEEPLAREWAEANPWRAPALPKDPATKRYLLTMFPYPSGDMHMGHVEVFSIHDAIARYMRMRGFEVLSPLGFDAFGLPAENAAIQRGVHPKEWTYSNIDKLLSSAQRIGCSFDWSRSFRTCDPSYYRWNQWLFLELYERGLAYRREAPAWWCPNDKTVLANEQVVNGLCERCDTPVEKRWLTQWFFKITDYADRLLDDMDINTGWSERLKMLQRNWIGRSFGAEVDFEIEGTGEKLTVFTTRPDTLWGATFFVVAPEHPVIDDLMTDAGVAEQLAVFRKEVERLTEIDRASTDRPKKGMFLGRHAVNPVNGERIPIWAADYVLMDYGTGAIMAVPAHDQRDFEFARQYGLDIRVVIAPEGESTDAGDMTEAYPHEGVMVNSGEFDGTPASEAVQKVTDWLAERGVGRHAKNYRLRDWLISRQRYWGTPIPIVYCPEHGEVPLRKEDLPVTLPDDVDFTPTGEASPLATAEEWVTTTCPTCGAPARRETDTMDTFVDSSWYFHRYLDPDNDSLPFDPDVSNSWMPIDQYTGGIEHAVMHLIYARFFQKVFVDIGFARDPEPFPALLNQGTVTMGGKRMSKSRGNLVDPQEAFERYGADALRLYMLFSGPPQADFDWPDEGVTAIGRSTYPWIQRVWRMCEDVRSVNNSAAPPGAAEETLRKRLHQTLERVTADYEEFSFNTAIARMMELVNEVYKYRAGDGADRPLLTETAEALLKMLAPMAPFLTDEQWRAFGHADSIHFAKWPEFDPEVTRETEVMMVVQINGKVRDTIPVPTEIDQPGMLARALASEKIQAHLDGGEPSKVIAKPPKLLNLVIPK